MRPRPFPLAALVLFVAALAASSAHAGRYRYADPTELGPYGVGHAVFDTSDPARADRMLRVEVWYPVDPADAVGEPTFYDFQFFGLGLVSPVAIETAPLTADTYLPLVVFSHGSCGVSFQSTPLMERLASHGMVVVAPNHTGNTANECIAGTDDPFAVSAADRPADVSLLIDYFLAKSADPEDDFFAHVNPFAIGVAGHSFGGYTTIAMASGIDEPSVGLHVEPDPRVRAIAPIAPASEFFSDAELASIDIPMFLLGGTIDDTTPIEPNTTRPWNLVTGRPIYRADLIGAGHLHFANACAIGQALLDFGVPELQIGNYVPGYDVTCGPDDFSIDEAQRIESFYVTAFFKRHLLHDARYDAFLTTDYAAAHEPLVDYSRKDPTP
jgi:predicted dienelactone hydrolase